MRLTKGVYIIGLFLILSLLVVGIVGIKHGMDNAYIKESNIIYPYPISFSINGVWVEGEEY